MLSSNFVPLRGVEVELPRTGGRLLYTSRNYVVTIDKDSRIYFNDAAVSGADELKRQLSESLNARGFQPDKERVIIRCDVRAPLTAVAEVLSVAEELNVKAVSFVDDASSFISYAVKPQLRTLGPKYGKLLGAIRNKMAEPGAGDAIVNAIKADGRFCFDVNGEPVELTEADVLITAVKKEGLVSETDGQVTVVLDTNLTPELIELGFVRELTSKLQTMRKEAGFEVADHIRIGYSGSDKVKAVFEKYAADIAADTLADGVSDALSGYEKDWDINGEAVRLSVERV